MKKCKVVSWGYVFASMVTFGASVILIAISTKILSKSMWLIMNGDVMMMLTSALFIAISSLAVWIGVEMLLMAGIGNLSGRVSPLAARSRFHGVSVALVISSALMVISIAHPAFSRPFYSTHHPVESDGRF